VYFSTQTH